MDKRTTDIVCYCTWVGLLVAVLAAVLLTLSLVTLPLFAAAEQNAANGTIVTALAGNREASRFHLNQSLVLGIFGLLGVIPCVGWVWAVFVAVWWCMGLTGAIRGVERPVPVLGGIRILL